MSATITTSGSGIVNVSGSGTVSCTTTLTTGTVTLSGCSNSQYDVTYVRTNYGIADTNTDLNRSETDWGIYSYDAGGGTYYMLYRNQLGVSNWIVTTFTDADPATLTNGDSLSGSSSESAAFDTTDSPVFLYGYYAPGLGNPKVSAHGGVP